MIAFRPTPLATDTVTLTPCTGTLYDEGNTIDCVPGCVGHFDANADPGDFHETAGTHYNPYPNVVLSLAAHLPGSTNRTSLLVPQRLSSTVKVFVNATFFLDSDTHEPVVVHIVVRAPADPDRHLAVASTSPNDLRMLLEQLT